MSTEQNKALVRRLYEENAENPDFAEFYAADCVFHDLPDEIRGLDNFMQAYGPIFASVSDLTSRILGDLVAEGDYVVAHFETQMTHTGEVMGVPATGKRLKMVGIDINRVANGKIVERWEVADFAGFMQQLQA